MSDGIPNGDNRFKERFRTLVVECLPVHSYQDTPSASSVYLTLPQSSIGVG